MRIRVLSNFGGRETQERRILPGEYEAENKALFGLADYLVCEGFAVVVDDAPAAPADESEATIVSVGDVELDGSSVASHDDEVEPDKSTTISHDGDEIVNELVEDEDGNDDAPAAPAARKGRK